jgi:hypothetical protein
MRLRCSLYARPVIVRGQQCAEAPLDPAGATKQLPARRYLALEGGLTAEPAWAVERPQAPSTGTRLGVPARGRSAWRPRRSGCRPCRRHPVRVLGQRPVSGVRCPVRASSVHACLSQRRVSSVRCHPSVQVSAVRGPVWASGVCALPRPLCPAGVRSWSAAVGRQPMAGMAGVGVVARCVHARLVVCLSRSLVLEAGAGGAGPAEVSVWTWPSSWEVVGSGQLDRVADQDRPGAREDRSLVGASAQRGLPSAAG